MNLKKAANLISNYSKNWRKKWLYIGLLAVVLVAGGWYLYSQTTGTYVPQEFYAARDRAATVSQRIEQLTDASVTTLGQISTADAKGDYKLGLKLVQQEIDRNEAIKEEAVLLSEELKIMATNLGAVKPKKAAEVGLQAATTGLELAQRLVNYNSLAEELLVEIEARLKKNGDPQTRQRIEAIILRMNEEAEAINGLNEKYREEMRAFDRIVK